MNPFVWIKNQSIFRDSRAMWLLVLCGAGTLFIVAFSILNIESSVIKVPIRYSGYFGGGLRDRGAWYLLYVLPLFSVATLFLNGMLAAKVHKLRPELSQIILSLHLVIMVFTFLIARALLGLA